MAIDFTKPAHVLAVHGVQVSNSNDIKSDDQIKTLIKKVYQPTI